MKAFAIWILSLAALASPAAERFVVSTGTVEREIPADRAVLSLVVTEEEADVSEDGEGSPRRNLRDPHEGSAAYPLRIQVRVRAKFELLDP